MPAMQKPQTAHALGIGQKLDLPVAQRADYNNWTLAPYNRWSFQRVQQFTRTTRVSRAATPAPLARREIDIGSIPFIDTSGKNTTVDAMLERTWTDGMLIILDGEVLSEQYFNGMKPDTLHLMMSCSKSITSTLIGLAVEAGQLAPGAQLTHYIPELKGTGMEGATVQEALDMQVGLKFEEDYADLNGDWRQMEIATGWREIPPDYTGPSDMVGYMQTLAESAGGHGAQFHYQSILTDALGTCLERATGRSFFELLEENIWHPMGAEQDFVSIVDGAGTAIFEGGFNCCLRDFARFGQLICDSGTVNGRQLVPHDWIEECRFASKDLIETFAHSEYGEALSNHAYHNQWWVRDPKRGVLMALGIHGQTLFIDPQRRFVAAKFSSQPEQADLGMALDQALAFEAIADALI
jgi:CubicO group peptidase (beta-lactamase class C family)